MDEEYEHDEAVQTGEEALSVPDTSAAIADPLPGCGEEPCRGDGEAGRGDDLRETLALLSAEVDRLREALTEKVRAAEEVEADYLEFSTLYPEVPLSAIPDEVRGRREGVSLSAAYALYERKRLGELRRAEMHNRENAERATGGVSGCDERYYTPSEVRAMSADEVRRNYADIMRSMPKWQ